MWIKKRHQIVLNLLKEPLRLFIRLKYNFKSNRYKLDDKPHLILSNHVFSLFVLPSNGPRFLSSHR